MKKEHKVWVLMIDFKIGATRKKTSSNSKLNESPNDYLVRGQNMIWLMMSIGVSVGSQILTDNPGTGTRFNEPAL